MNTSMNQEANNTFTCEKEEKNMMTIKELESKAYDDIQQALEDYGKHTSQQDVLRDVEDVFIGNVAHDSVLAKRDLRELFRKSPVWNEDLQAIVINGTRTHNPDYRRIKDLAWEILCPAWRDACDAHDCDKQNAIDSALEYFGDPSLSDAYKEAHLQRIAKVAPHAYAPGKKMSRVFKAFCQALGIVDETQGSNFQRLYAQFADELTTRKIDFKLYVSINPAHFLTMSNPKEDRRGTMLTSCHSFNSTDYSYNNGCSGYARDETSFIVFTVDDPKNPESFNNRKTTRQIFAYRPGSGLLLQSRMYNTSGGVYGAAEDAGLYRDLIQREICELEGVPNLWRTHHSYEREYSRFVEQGEGFGGYPDWIYDNFDCHISFRTDCDMETVEPLIVGTYGLCVKCGCETSEGMLCEDCNHGDERCDECGEWCDETFLVYDPRGYEQYVCINCRNDNYTYCDACDRYHDNEVMTYIDGRDYCDECRERECEQCEDCGEWHVRSRMYSVYDKEGNEVFVCKDCLEDYAYCDVCNEWHPKDECEEVRLPDGRMIHICEDCKASGKTFDGYSTSPKLCYEVGDKVVIKNIRAADTRKYEFGINDVMEQYARKVATITQVDRCMATDDDHIRYCINLDHGCWSWSRSMFEGLAYIGKSEEEEKEAM